MIVTTLRALRTSRAFTDCMQYIVVAYLLDGFCITVVWMDFQHSLLVSIIAGKYSS